MIESGLLGIIGGAIGVLAGVAISSLAGGVLSGALAVGPGSGGVSVSFAASYSPWLIIGALLASFVLGAIAGVLPARRGAKLRPVEALRYE
jgi:putative ABC transport system permease protein